MFCNYFEEFRLSPRRKSSKDVFFSDGDIFCNEIVKKFTCVLTNEDDKIMQSSRSLDMKCTEAGCNRQFESLSLYECHYAITHKHVCQECRVKLPNPHLLQLHITEKHSPFFSNLEYSCVVLGCKKSFLTSKERKDHMIKDHKYPPNFRYLIYLGSSDSTAESGKRNSTNKQKKGASKVKPAANRDGHVGTGSSDHSNISMDLEVPASGDNSKESRNENTENEEEMDVDPVPPASNKKRLPQEICFGMTSHRSFSRKGH